MNFLRLNDFLLTVLFENDEIIAIDKPYGINSHTNDAKIGNSDFIQDGLIEIYEKQLGVKLHIVHRLDQTTTGVIIFAKSQEAAKKYAAYFFDRQVKKTYIFITASKSKSDSFKIDQTIVHKAKDLEAETHFKLLTKSRHYELWQANPLTGRNHQIRIHAKAAEIPLLGDEKYGGALYPFICLHNQQIEFPNGITLKSAPPLYFTDLKILEDLTLAKALFSSDRRLRLFEKNDLQNQCFRLMHDKDESGFTLDHFGQYLVLSCFNENWTLADQESFSEFSNYMSKPVLVRLMHNRGKDPLNKSQFVILPKKYKSEVETVWVAKEDRIQYEFRSDSGVDSAYFQIRDCSEAGFRKILRIKRS